MRKCSFFVTIILIFTMLTPLSVDALSFPPGIDIYSDAVYMVSLDYDDPTGKLDPNGDPASEVIFSKNADKKLYPASLTKIMTAIICLENIQDIETETVTAPVSVFDELYKTNASTADFRIGEVVTYNDLLYGLMLPSACEAASIIAYGVAGSVDAFVEMMNAKAKELGAVNTNFTNAHGLFDENQCTTAYDLYLITKYAMTFSKFNEISNTPRYTLGVTNKHANQRTIIHTNVMLDKIQGGSKYYYEYAKGIKTGTLEEAGRCLVTTASKDGKNYLIVSLNAPMTDADGNKVFYNCLDHKNLYEWAFNNISSRAALDKGEQLGEVKVNNSAEKDYVLVTPKDSVSFLWPNSMDISAIQKVIDLDESVNAPVKKGDSLGTIKLVFQGETIFETSLIATDDVEKSVLKVKIQQAKEFFSSIWFKIGLIVIAILIILYILLIIMANRKKKRRSKNRKIKKSRRF